MAYTREGKETFEVSYPIKDVWEAIPKAIAKLEWKVEEVDQEKHHAKIKTRGAFLSYGSEMQIDVTAIDEKTTKMTITAETPVTTITSIADYGRTGERINVFIATMGKIMSGE
jgi:carbon monoxide dehydrogenase subunit G